MEFNEGYQNHYSSQEARRLCHEGFSIANTVYARQLNIEDASQLLTLVQDPVNKEHLNSFGEPTSLWYRDLDSIYRFFGAWADADTIRLGLWNQSPSDLMGLFTFMPYLHKNVLAEGYKTAEVGYFLSKSYSRKGHMPEILMAMSHFAHDGLGLERLEALTHLDNTPSQRVLRKSGFIEGRKVDKRWNGSAALCHFTKDLSI